MREETVVERRIQPVVVRGEQLPKTHNAEGVDQGLVRGLAQRVEIQADAAVQEERLLGESVEAFANLDPRDAGDIDVVDDDVAGV